MYYVMETKEYYRTAMRNVLWRQEPAKPTTTLQDLRSFQCCHVCEDNEVGCVPRASSS
jgi:hypothetical protein